MQSIAFILDYSFFFFCLSIYVSFAFHCYLFLYDKDKLERKTPIVGHTLKVWIARAAIEAIFCDSQVFHHVLRGGVRAHAPEAEAEAKSGQHKRRESQHERADGERPDDGVVVCQRSHTHVSLFIAPVWSPVKISIYRPRRGISRSRLVNAYRLEILEFTGATATYR